MDIKKLINLSFFIGLLFWVGMVGSLLSAVYHVFFDSKEMGIYPSTISASIFLVFIFISVIMAKFIKITPTSPNNESTVYIISAVMSLLIIFILFLLIHF